MAQIYGGAGPTALLVPHFVKARTAQGLVRACFENNSRLKAFVNYYSIQYVEKDKAWYAWFYLDVSNGITTVTERP
jgi:hypothetical protein